MNKFKIGKTYRTNEELFYKMCRGSDFNAREIKSIEEANQIYFGGILFKFEKDGNEYVLTCLSFYKA